MKTRLISHGSVLALLLAAVGAGGACMSATSSNSTTGSGGKGGSTSTTGAGGTHITTGTGGSTSTTGAGGVTVTTGAGGAGGTATVVRKDCAVKTTMMNPVLLDFESYNPNGTVTASMFGAAFGGTTPNTGDAYIGPFAYPENATAPMPTLSMVAGHPPSSMWAVSETVAQASVWGMGGGFWVGSQGGPSCVNGSAYRGISFWVRGSGPLNVFSFTLNMDSTTLPDTTNPAAGGTCPGTADTCKAPTMQNIPLTADWTQQTILWTDFTPGMSGMTSVVPNGDNISGLAFSVPLQFMLAPGATDPAVGPYNPVPATNLLINIDDIQFVP